MTEAQRSDPSPHVLWELVQTAHVAERRFREVFGRLGLTPAQYGVLASLADGDDLSQAELARAVLVRPQSLTAVIDALVAAGLVVREGSPGRGRRKTLSLSRRGREVFDEARPDAYRLLSQEETGLGERETVQLSRLLHTVQTNLETPSRSDARGVQNRMS